jgi:hypothetical protein
VIIEIFSPLCFISPSVCVVILLTGFSTDMAINFLQNYKKQPFTKRED